MAEILGILMKEGDSKKKQMGAGKESQGPDPAEGAAYSRPLDHADTYSSLKTGRAKVS